MADESITSEFGDMFSDYEPDTEQLDTLDDANDGIYDLLGMSEEDKKAARESLAEEDNSLGGADSAAGAPVESPSTEEPVETAEGDSAEPEVEMTMEEKAAKEALEFIKQANAGGDSVDVETTEESTNEEDRLNNMLDDIFAVEESKEVPEVNVEVQESVDEASEGVADDGASAETTENGAADEGAMEVSLGLGDVEESAEAPASEGDAPAEEEQVSFDELVEAASGPERAAEPEEAPQDALSQMNSIIDNAVASSDAGETALDIPAEPEESKPQHVELTEEPEVDVSGVDLVDYNSVDISDDLLSEIDVTEDLTKGLEGDGDLAGQEVPLTKRQLKKKMKAEAKAAKKAAKEAKKIEKAAKKLKPEEKDPNDIIVDLENAFANEDVISTMEKIADVGVEDAAAEAVDNVDLNGFLGEDGAEGEVAEKKSFKEKMALLLFGPPEEGDYPTEEEIEAKKAAKEAKIAAKEKAKEEKEIQKKEAAEAKAAKKNQAKEVAVVKKAAAADKKAKIAAEEEAEDALERKITPKQVITTFVILAVLAATVVLGTNEFSYHMVITRATNYFEMQKYRKAYDQIVGVDVKDRDKEIKDKIYCVMYVQQQLDSYDNFCKLEMYENALDSLVKGVRKYEEHYEEAKAMGIAADLDGLHAEIEKALSSRYGLTMDTVKSWTSLDQTTYTDTILNYVSNMKLPMEYSYGQEPELDIKDNEDKVVD